MATVTMKPITEDPSESSYGEEIYCLKEEGGNLTDYYGEGGWGSAGSLARTENSSDLATIMVASTESLGDPEALTFSGNSMDYNDHEDYIWMGLTGKSSMHYKLGVNVVITNSLFVFLFGSCYAFMETAKYIRLIVWVGFHWWFMITLISAMSRWFFVGGLHLCCVIVFGRALLVWVAWGKVQFLFG